MRTELIRVGNSRGIRIPKPFIEQIGLGETVELRLEKDRLVISPERALRDGWEDAFRAAGAASRDEIMLEPSETNEFDKGEWRW